MPACLPVSLGNLDMHLRSSELQQVAAGLSGSAPAAEPDQIRLLEAVRQLPLNDRAAFWELAVRHLGRQKALAEAASEIGMDELRARDLVERISRVIASEA